MGDLLREGRQSRRMSQLDLAAEAKFRPDTLVFSKQPSREMLLHFAEQLQIPLHGKFILT